MSSSRKVLQVLIGQLGKQTQVDAILRKRLRVLLKPKFRQSGFNVHPSQGRYAEAEPLYKRSLAIYEKALGPTHPNVATILESYGVLLRETGRNAEANEMEARATTIRAKHAEENPAN